MDVSNAFGLVRCEWNPTQGRAKKEMLEFKRGSSYTNPQWIFQVLVKGGRQEIITQLAAYIAYTPGIVLAFKGFTVFNPKPTE